jgi:hypothetical protein
MRPVFFFCQHKSFNQHEINEKFYTENLVTKMMEEKFRFLKTAFNSCFCC